jgi:hypothetical protein
MLIAGRWARGGAPRTVADQACMAAIVFMVRTSSSRALLPVGEFGCGGRGRVGGLPAPLGAFSTRQVPVL